MKFRAQVKFKGEKNAYHLIRAFFVNFNPESSIAIKGNNANLEVVFDKPPMEIIDAIGYCEVINFQYGNSSEEETSEKAEQEAVEEEIPEAPELETVEEETSEEAELETVEEEIPEEVEQEMVEEEISEAANQEATEKNDFAEVVKPQKVNISELEEIAKKATSFENFVKLVAEWLEMGSRKEFFEQLAIASNEVDKISWKELEKKLKDKGVFYTQWDKIWSVQQVSEKFKEKSVTMLPLLKEIKEYKDYFFGHEKKQLDEDEIPKPRLKMECMPEIKHFEETLATVDKTQPIEDRIKYVLGAMGLKKRATIEQQEILEITNTAVRLGRIAFDLIFLKSKIPMESSMNARMTFSKFINDFAKEYASDKKVKVIDFLKELQEIVMFESEIENYTDFIE